jgi:hypothetical protein
MGYKQKIHLLHNGRPACGLAPLGSDYGPIERVTCNSCLNSIAGKNRRAAMVVFDYAAVIRANLEDFLIEGKAYPGPLPPAIQNWYCYCTDGGHCALVVLDADYQATAEDPAADLADYQLPAPIKTILREYRTAPGLVLGQPVEVLVADIPYSTAVGLMAPPEDTEW